LKNRKGGEKGKNMKNNKFCVSRTLVYLVLLVIAVVGAFYVMSYSNRQKLNLNSKASSPEASKQIFFDDFCRKKTGNTRATCGLRSICVGTNRTLYSPKTPCGYDINGDGKLNNMEIVGSCCVDGTVVPPTSTIAPTQTGASAPTQTGASAPTIDTCASKMGLIKALPKGESLRISKISNMVYAGFQVYTGFKRASGTVVKGDNCALAYKTCMFSSSEVGTKTSWYVNKRCKTPSTFSNLSSSQKQSIKSLCLKATGKVAEKLWNLSTYRTFTGSYLNVPVFDGRVVGTNNPDYAYCEVEINTCEIKSGSTVLQPLEKCIEVHN
jgi:hypothetical protein